MLYEVFLQVPIRKKIVCTVHHPKWKQGMKQPDLSIQCKYDKHGNTRCKLGPAGHILNEQLGGSRLTNDPWLLVSGATKLKFIRKGYSWIEITVSNPCRIQISRWRLRVVCAITCTDT